MAELGDIPQNASPEFIVGGWTFVNYTSRILEIQNANDTSFERAIRIRSIQEPDASENKFARIEKNRMEEVAFTFEGSRNPTPIKTPIVFYNYEQQTDLELGRLIRDAGNPASENFGKIFILPIETAVFDTNIPKGFNVAFPDTQYRFARQSVEQPGEDERFVTRCKRSGLIVHPTLHRYLKEGLKPETLKGTE